MLFLLVPSLEIVSRKTFKKEICVQALNVYINSLLKTIIPFLFFPLLIDLCVQEQMKCIQLLQSFILDHRLRMQTDLDRKKLDYFEGKCELVLQKIK